MGQVSECMGGCVTKNRKEDNEENERESVGTIFQPEEAMSPTRKPLTKKKQSEFKEDPEETYNTLNDHLRKSSIEEDDWKEEHLNPPSVILRKGTKKRPKSTVEAGEQKVQTIIFAVDESKVDTSDSIDATVSDEGAYSKLIFNTKEVDIEFTLPKSRAGPLVVPFTVFEKYDPSK